ncbi:enoyl-CoA hydratase/isomerase family protein [soil metagenome]
MLRVSRDGSTAVWTLDRPEARNALSGELVEKLTRAIDEAARDATVRSAILTGAGGSFASGGDLRELRGRSNATDAALLSDLGEALCRAIAETPFPVIAVLTGAAIGGGAELAVACDLRIAEDRAKICFKQTRMGVTTAWGTLPRLLSLVGTSATARLLYTAQELRAVEARAMGLIDHIAEPGSAMATAIAWCTDIEASAPGAIAETKRLLRSAEAEAYARLRPLERDAFIRTWASEAHDEAMEAYFSRRAPKW